MSVPFWALVSKKEFLIKELTNPIHSHHASEKG